MTPDRAVAISDHPASTPNTRITSLNPSNANGNYISLFRRTVSVLQYLTDNFSIINATNCHEAPTALREAQATVFGLVMGRFLVVFFAPGGDIAVTPMCVKFGVGESTFAALRLPSLPCSSSPSPPYVSIDLPSQSSPSFSELGVSTACCRFCSGSALLTVSSFIDKSELSKNK